MDEAAQKQQRIRNAFGAFYDRSFNTAYGYVYARVGDERAAEEILQETYASAWAGFDKYAKRSGETTWVIGIARHKIADYYRREAKRGLCEESTELDAVRDPVDIDAVIVGSETRGYVASAMEALNPVYRYALAMKYLDGYSLKAIARVLGRTPKAVDGILQRAKAAFIERYTVMAKEDECRE